MIIVIIASNNHKSDDWDGHNSERIKAHLGARSSVGKESQQSHQDVVWSTRSDAVGICTCYTIGNLGDGCDKLRRVGCQTQGCIWCTCNQMPVERRQAQKLVSAWNACHCLVRAIQLPGLSWRLNCYATRRRHKMMPNGKFRQKLLPTKKIVLQMTMYIFQKSPGTTSHKRNNFERSWPPLTFKKTCEGRKLFDCLLEAATQSKAPGQSVQI